MKFRAELVQNEEDTQNEKNWNRKNISSRLFHRHIARCLCTVPVVDKNALGKSIEGASNLTSYTGNNSRLATSFEAVCDLLIARYTAIYLLTEDISINLETLAAGRAILLAGSPSSSRVPSSGK